MDAVDEFADPFRTDEMITIALENDQGEFKVQKASLCDASAYFKSALEGGFKEGTERKLRLPGCSAEVMKTFLFWHSRKAFPKFQDEVAAIQERKQRYALAAERSILLIQVWIFADACLIPKLKNDAMSCLVGIAENKSTSCYVIRQAYTLTPKDSPLRKFAVDVARHEYKFDTLSATDFEELAKLPGFVAELMTSLRPYVGKMGGGSRDRLYCLPVSEYVCKSE